MFAHVPVWGRAGIWGLAGASSLVIGAALAYLVRLPTHIELSWDWLADAERDGHRDLDAVAFMGRVGDDGSEHG